MAKRSKKKKRKSKSKKKKSFKRKKKKILRKKKKKISSKKKGSRQIEDSDGNIVFKVPPTWEKQAYVNQSQYSKKYKLSLKDNEGFWAKEGKRITWMKPYTKI